MGRARDLLSHALLQENRIKESFPHYRSFVHTPVHKRSVFSALRFTLRFTYGLRFGGFTVLRYVTGFFRTRTYVKHPASRARSGNFMQRCRGQHKFTHGPSKLGCGRVYECEPELSAHVQR